MMHRWLDDLTVSEETSLSLLARAKQGDAVALEALMGRYLTRLQRWASGRVPRGVRSLLDTDDVVQDALLNTLRRLDHFEPRHDGALLAYLRQAVANRIKNELRRTAIDPESVEPDSLPSAQPSALETILSRQSIERYERAFAAGRRRPGGNHRAIRDELFVRRARQSHEPRDGRCGAEAHRACASAAPRAHEPP